MRPVFVGNFEHETRHSDLDRLFSKFGKVERIDIKSGYAFVYFEDERDAEDAIRELDYRPFGYSRRRLSVEWSRQGERGPRERGGSRPVANTKPTKTLFVINFDPLRTRTRDVERHFEPYGKVSNVRIRRNFAFVQFETQEDATRALENTHMSKIMDRVVTVEYAFRDDERDSHDSPRRGGYDSPRRGGFVKREVSSYGHPDSPRHKRSRTSPDYGRSRSPIHDRYNGRMGDRGRSPEYGRSRSPVGRSRV